MDGGPGKLPGGIRARLTDWARQHAWLHTRPRPRAGSKQTETPPARVVTLDEQGGDSQDLELPDPGQDQCLLDWLFEAGLMRWSEAGPQALTWADWHAWATMTQTSTTSWQAATLAHLSAEYAASAGAALDPDCPAPIVRPINQAAVAAQVARAFGAFAKTTGAKK